MFVGIVLFLQTMCHEFHKLIMKCALYVCMFLCKEIKKKSMSNSSAVTACLV